MNDAVFSAPHEYCTMLRRDRCNILISHRFLVHRRGVHKCVHPLGYAAHHPSGQLTVMGHQVMNISEIVAMTLGIGCIRPWSGRDLFTTKQFLPSATKLQRLCFYTCLSVILFTGGSASLHAGTPPGPGTPPPWDQAPPPTPLQQTATVADGTHPTGMHSCYR